jgi:hypothetical protein
MVFLEDSDNLPLKFPLQKQETSKGMSLAVEPTGKSQTENPSAHCIFAYP